MKSILPIFASLLWAAASLNAPAQTPLPLGHTAPAPSTPAENNGDALLRRVLSAVNDQVSISAKIRHRVDLLERPLTGSGLYLQQGRGGDPRLRLELQLRTAGQTSSLLQVCDGTNLWLYQFVDGSTSLGRVDMDRLRRARPKSPPEAPAQPSLMLGGLPKMLAGIAGSFRFGTVAESRLDDQLRVWTIEGQWKPEKLAALLPDQKNALESGQPADETKLAPNLPDRVVMHVGCDDLFPYRFEYWRAETSGKKTPAKDRGQLLVLMELYEVQLGAPIDPRQFVYSPGDLQPMDRTTDFLDQLGLEDAVPSEANKNRPPRR